MARRFVAAKPAPRNEMSISINCTLPGSIGSSQRRLSIFAIGASRIHSVNFRFINVALT
jgi:hypothetical protein